MSLKAEDYQWTFKQKYPTFRLAMHLHAPLHFITFLFNYSVPGSERKKEYFNVAVSIYTSDLPSLSESIKF